MDMTVIEQIEAIKKSMCDDYCRYPIEYHNRYLRDEFEDEVTANNSMCENVCSKCPLTEL